MRPNFTVTWAIALRDFRSFFASPKGLAIFFFFLIFMGFFFHSFIGTFIDIQQQAAMRGGQAPPLERMFTALFYNLYFILVLIVPAVTMASFAEENKNHSIRLLHTAPLRPLHIVLGKFLATLMMMSLVLLASFIFPLFTIGYGNPDLGVILSAYLGLFLLVCSQLSLGIWISSMTKNQFLAFLFTMFGLFLLLILNWLVPNLSGGGVTEGILKYLASWGHLEQLLKGMITFKDIFYFICFTSLFLFFTNVVLDSQRWR